MNAEIISVGTELLLGNTLNTDSRDISLKMSELGINVFWHSVVGDNPERLRQAVQIARDSAELIITTGGLGPTCDDLTKQTLAQCFGLPLMQDEKALLDISSFFNSIGGNMTENNLQQAFLPEGCTPFYNSCGTAPGCAFEAMGKTVIMLPGPPKECLAMLQKSALPYLREKCGETIYSRTVNVFGIGESAAEQKLRQRMNALQNPTLAPYAKEGEVSLRITAKAENEATAKEIGRAHV